MRETLADAYWATGIAVFVWIVFVEPFWPWDWSGRRKAITLTPSDRDF